MDNNSNICIIIPRIQRQPKNKKKIMTSSSSPLGWTRSGPFGEEKKNLAKFFCAIFDENN